MSIAPISNPDSDQIYFKQLLSGRDFATDNQLAQQMVNFVYLIGDKSTRECMIVDPAYAVEELLSVAEKDDMNVVGALATHYHPDHVGGSMMGANIDGIATLLDKLDIPIHVQELEAQWIMRTTGVSASHLHQHQPGDTVKVGEIEICLVHTPGHTPGSQCFLVDNRLIAGDTLFLEGCGRTDLPGSDPSQMFDSLQTLAALPDQTVVYPGHRYSDPSSRALPEVRQTNYVFKPKTKADWLQWFS
ncbi:MAG: MBL fold metallo-hydrolase [Actinobacteria bacterium]|nr:MAG: MBL fold metallo-hydrolase [Actinomycetota bacterium]